MKQQNVSIASEVDGLTLDLCIVEPDSEVKGVVQIAHGMAEHKERYLPFMEFLATNGFVCAIHDHRGHGKSVKKKEDYGYFYSNDPKAIVKDTHQMTKWLKQQYPDIPFFLFGHSMGSLVVRCYTKEYDDELDGLVVCGSPSKNPMAKTALHLIRVLTKVKGSHHRSSLIQNLAFGSFSKKFPQEKSSNAWICSDASVVEAYDQDEGCGFVFTLHGFYHLMSLMIMTYDPKGWKMSNKNLPIFFIAGKEDPCIENEQKFHQAVSFMKERGYSHVEAKLYEGMRHEILNEQGKEQVMQDVLAWFYKKMKEK